MGCVPAWAARIHARVLETEVLPIARPDGLVYEQLGPVVLRLWRAARVVVDTGIHHHGWQRVTATAWMTANVLLEEAVPLDELEVRVRRWVVEQGGRW